LTGRLLALDSGRAGPLPMSSKSGPTGRCCRTPQQAQGANIGRSTRATPPARTTAAWTLIRVRRATGPRRAALRGHPLFALRHADVDLAGVPCHSRNAISRPSQVERKTRPVSLGVPLGWPQRSGGSAPEADALSTVLRARGPDHSGSCLDRASASDSKLYVRPH
jgi:hypothetical protein